MFRSLIRLFIYIYSFVCLSTSLTWTFNLHICVSVCRGICVKAHIILMFLHCSCANALCRHHFHVLAAYSVFSCFSSNSSSMNNSANNIHVSILFYLIWFHSFPVPCLYFMLIIIIIIIGKIIVYSFCFWFSKFGAFHMCAGHACIPAIDCCCCCSGDDLMFSIARRSLPLHACCFHMYTLHTQMPSINLYRKVVLLLPLSSC